MCRTNIPGNIRSLERKFPGTFVKVPSGNFHSEERKYRGAKSPWTLLKTSKLRLCAWSAEGSLNQWLPNGKLLLLSLTTCHGVPCSLPSRIITKVLKNCKTFSSRLRPILTKYSRPRPWLVWLPKTNPKSSPNIFTHSHTHSHSFYCIRKSVQFNSTNRRSTDTTGTSKSSQSLSKACP